jgi:hypothetical protein
MKFTGRLALLLALATLGCASLTARRGQEEDIREAVFRWQFTHHEAGLAHEAKVFFLAVGEKGGDPPEGLLRRFAGHRPPVRKASASRLVPGNGVVDRQTGERGLRFRITRIRWVSEEEAVVNGDWFEGGLNASGDTFTVRKRDGRWQVTVGTAIWSS